LTKIEIEGTIRTVKTTDTRKAEFEKQEETLVVRDADGINRMNFIGPAGKFDGLNPEETVKITITGVQKTLKESVKGKA